MVVIMASILLLNKPFQVLSQFTDSEGRRTLAEYVKMKGFYPAGRLDYDSEGLLLLCDNGQLQARIADPKHKLMKYYWVQVEGEISKKSLDELRQGVALKDGITAPAEATRINAPNAWERVPPIRQRQNSPTSWINIGISEGKNRQIRRMTAHVGFPTLRLIRHKIGPWTINNIAPGNYGESQVFLPENTSKNKQNKNQYGSKKPSSSRNATKRSKRKNTS